MSNTAPNANPVTIIGSGMAGYTLARELRKLDKDTPITLITQDDGANYAKPTLSNALTAGKEPAVIALGDAEKMADTLNATIRTHCTVSHIDTAQKRLVLNTGGSTETLDYNKLVLAVGANPVTLPIVGDAAEQVLHINNLNDYTAFHAQLTNKDSTHVAIIGAGLIGCEFANDLLNAGHKVTVVDLAEQPLSNLLPKDLAGEFMQAMQTLGVTFILGSSVSEVNVADSGLVLHLSNGDRLEADMVLSAVGLRPNTELAQNAGIACNRGIIVNSCLQTSAADVYAIGDCAEVEGHVLLYVMPLMAEARALAKTLAGEETAVAYPAMPVGVKTPAAPLVVLPPPADLAAGLTADTAITWSSETTGDGMIASAHDEAGTLRGFVLLGKAAGKQRLTLAKQVPDLL